MDNNDETVTDSRTVASVEQILTMAENAIIDLRGCSRLTARTYLRTEILKADNSYYGKNGI